MMIHFSPVARRGFFLDRVVLPCNATKGGVHEPGHCFVCRDRCALEIGERLIDLFFGAGLNQNEMQPKRAYRLLRVSLFSSSAFALFGFRSTAKTLASATS
jgi:hypothetical protein